MKRNIQREKKLDAFTLNLDDLEKLCTELRKEFGDDDVSTSITFNLPREEQTFKSVDEIREHMPGCKRVGEFSISFHSHPSGLIGVSKSLYIKSPNSSEIFATRAHVSTSSDSEAWSSGVCETAASYLQKHKTWCHWVTWKTIWWPFIVILYYCILQILFLWLSSMGWIDLAHSEDSNPLVLMSVLVLPSLLLIEVLPRIRGQLFPYGIVLIKQKQHDIQRIAAILSILASITVIIGTFIYLLN